VSSWQKQLEKSIIHPRDIPVRFIDGAGALARITDAYPMRVNPYFLSLIKKKGDPIWKQVIPDEQEFRDTICMTDPLNEENLSPVPNLVHKYPDRALFLVSSECAVYCRFCTRKRKVGTDRMKVSRETVREGLNYLRKTTEIRDVLLSGGDPLLLTDEYLQWILEALRRIKTIEIIRIHTRVPCALPMRVTTRLVRMLKKFHPLYINIHFNHPDEITAEAAKACGRLADNGFPLGGQTVLLRGVNNSAATMKQLMHRLLQIRVRPYYLFQADMTRGTNHFRTSIEEGLAIMKTLIGHTSGLAVPAYTVDAPGGGGKIPLTPDYVKRLDSELIFENYCGVTCSYGNVVY